MKRLPILIGLLLSASPQSGAQPVPHHFEGITASPDGTITLSLNGSVSNLVSISGTISNQFLKMFDLYLVDTSTNLVDWTPVALLQRTNNDPQPLIVRDIPTADRHESYYRVVTNQLPTAFPKPRGPFAVGTVDRVMVDPARTKPYRYTPKTNAFMVTFWYPADPPATGVLPAAMWDLRFAADANLYSNSGFNPQWAKLAPKLFGHRYQDLPLKSGGNRLPIVIHSHGLGGGRKLVSQFAEELASHGYVVVSMDHTDCWATEFSDGRYLAGDAGDVEGRLKDLKFLLDELGSINARDPLFAGRLDLDRIGVEGGSYGGMVVETCRSDGRVKCAMIYDGGNVYLSSAGLQKPLFIALGESNYFEDADRWLYGKSITNAVFLKIRGADHFTPSDVGWTAQVPWGRGPAQVFNDCSVWFFNTYLKGETPPFPTNPEIYSVLRK